MSTDTQKANKTLMIVAVALGLLLIGAVVVMSKLYVDQKAKSDDYEYKIEDLNTEIIDLEDNLKSLNDEIENKDLQIEEKDRLLAERELEMLNKQKKIDMLYRANKITKEEKEALMAKVEQLEYYVKKYQGQIDELKVQVAVLSDENKNLRSGIDSLSEAKFNLETDNRLKSTILEAAAILKAINLKYYRIKGSGKPVEETVFRKGRMDDLRICFDLLENIVAKGGSKDIFLTIFTPDHKEIMDMNKQSGYFTFEEKERVYTIRKTIEYERSTQEVCMEFAQPENLEYVKGIYTIKVFCEGFEIGAGRFEVK